MKKTDAAPEKLEPKAMEKKRRTIMKELCYKLGSLVPSPSSRSYKLFTNAELFNQSTAYIEELRKRIEQLKEKKNEALRLLNNNVNDDYTVTLPIMKVKELDTGLQVLLIISTLKRNFTFYEVVGIMEEAGAEVVNGGYTIVGDKVYYNLHAVARISRVGVEITGVREKLQELIDRSL